ncbi:spermine/spermidine synthase domain-containing protein [Ditylenchus destructor]|uniref:Spermine/spermidine synthase domain-containing protein n=1 Tax=Ditylenchus destructor TaxID=166010 RepID=A0AAD4N5D0_9BILA|nr:spermine/spermidine synthase domain-containing protein [Ditylenchus destructor]
MTILVLIIGGGDGGILREVLKHPSVENVTMCEIDEMVINVAKKYLPNLSKAFSNPKLQLHIGDGFEFLKNHQNEFDVVITDSSDPVGPAESLFGESYYKLINNALRDGGILSSQGECIWLHIPLITRMIKMASGLFPNVRYAYSCMPTYPSGAMGYLIASKKEDIDLSQPRRTLSDEQLDKMGLRFYTPEVHHAAFALPSFLKKALAEAENNTSAGSEQKS